MLHIFSDSSCSKTKGIGCFSLLTDLKEDEIEINYIVENCTSSTRMEFITILNALEHAKNKNLINGQILIYTDCESFVRYGKTKTNNSIDLEMNSAMQKYFDNYKIEIIKMKGHNKKTNIVTREQEIFSILDKKARKILRDKNKIYSNIHSVIIKHD